MATRDYGNIALRTILFLVGVVGLCAGLVMVWQFGETMSKAHAVALACASVLASFAFAFRRYILSQGDHSSARWALVFGVGLVTVELFSHLGYTIGMRTISAESSGFQRTKLEDNRDSVTTLKKSIAFYEAREKDLGERLKAAVSYKVGDWSVTTAPSSSAELEGLIKAKRQEVKIEEDRGGCKDRCLARMNELGHLAKLKALAGEIESNQRMHSATLEALAKAQNQFAGTELIHSPARAQTDFVSSLWHLMVDRDVQQALSPSDISRKVVDIMVGLLLALASTAIPAVAFYMAFWKPVKNELPVATAELGEVVHLSSTGSATLPREVALSREAIPAEAVPEEAKGSTPDNRPNVITLNRVFHDRKFASQVSQALSGFKPALAA